MKSITKSLCRFSKPVVWHQDDPVWQEVFEAIRTHFNILTGLRLSAAEDNGEVPNERETKIQEAIKFFKEWFSLESLKDYVGDISFARITSIMRGKPGDNVTPHTALEPTMEDLVSILMEKIPTDVKEWTNSEKLDVVRKKIADDVKMSLKCLGIMTCLLKSYESIHNSVEDVRILQEILDNIEDHEEKWALQEDIIGKTLWICFCAIHAEINQILPAVLAKVLKNPMVEPEMQETKTETVTYSESWLMPKQAYQNISCFLITDTQEIKSTLIVVLE
ncbi:hypothetical protein SCLCIDRAFT_9137 [Scleroderma citrinum Foug A]|uniref:Uncharacterized protein n=1 Tax=Scleroderma citrinum Foug A TaxID=1036808 RepID=A0A0C2ZLV0_9AGAM|nr:hypothetical protein SCLCIDRAFT_9137 [Scleroderma citrinum Foug A]